jgi:hypothetical protein
LIGKPAGDTAVQLPRPWEVQVAWGVRIESVDWREPAGDTAAQLSEQPLGDTAAKLSRLCGGPGRLGVSGRKG